MLLRGVTVSVLVFFLVAACSKSKVQPVSQPQLNEHQRMMTSVVGEEVAAHLDFFAEGPEVDGSPQPDFTFRFDESGPDLDLTAAPSANALHYAAVLYSLTSEDFTATLGEVVQAGFMPYSNGLDGIDSDLTIPNSKDHGQILNAMGALSDDFGSPDWLLEQKWTVVKLYYHDYFFESDPQTSLPALIPVAAFWTNALTGQPCVEGPNKGDYQLVQVLELYNRPNKLRFENGNRAVSVRKLNRVDQDDQSTSSLSRSSSEV